MNGAGPKRGRGAAASRGGRPTIKSIARLAEVAPSTVSRALNGDASISEATRRRIARISRRLGFVPNTAARGLVTRRSSLVALVVGVSPNPFYLGMIPVLAQRLAARGFGLMIFRMGDGDTIEGTLSALARHHVGGSLIAAASLTREAARLCSRFDIPIVMINRFAGLDAPSVTCDNREAGRRVARLLLDEGRRRLAYVGGEPGVASFQDAEREAGFAEELAVGGAPGAVRVAGRYGYEGGVAAATALRRVHAGQGADGVFVANDIMAFGVIDGLRRGGVRVPRDTSVVGFDDLPQASWLCYELTTVRQPVEPMIDAALALLERRIADPDAKVETRVLHAELVRRGSTR